MSIQTQNAQITKGFSVPNITSATAAIARHVGFPEARARQIARRLREDDLMPQGAPGVTPEVDRHDLLTLLIALASDATAARAAEAVATYGALVPGGANPDGAPASIPRTVRSVLEVLAAEGAEGQPASPLNIEFVSTWPEIALHWEDGTVSRFRQPGALASHWEGDRIRKSITVTGAAFGALFKEVFA